MVIENPYEPKSASKASDASTSALGAASPLDRLAAHIADLVILLPLMAIAMAPFRREAVSARMSQDLAASDLAVLNALIAALMVGVLWETLLLAWKGTTPGRAMFGLRVVDLWSGKRPRPLNVFLRALSWWLSVLCLGLPFMAVFANDKRRPLHDRVADTVVVTRHARRVAAHPTTSELAFGAMFMTAGLVMLTSLVLMLSQKWSNKATSSGATSLASETSGMLCDEISQVHEEWRSAPGQPQASRLSVALTMFFASRVDATCLQREADHVLWSKEDSTLGYLALAVSRPDLDGRKYRDKVCADDLGSEACFVARSFHPVSELNLRDGGSAEETLGALQSLMTEVESPPPLSASSAEWYRAFRMERWWKSDAEAGLLALTTPAPHRDLDATYATWRAQFLWQLGRDSEARAMLNEKLPLFYPREKFRAQVAWCGAELALQGCGAAAKRACAAPLESLERNEPIAQFLNDRQVIDLYRGAECQDQGRPSANLVARLSREASSEARRWLTATQAWREGDRKLARAEIEKLLGVETAESAEVAGRAKNQPENEAANSAQANMFLSLSPELQVESLARLSEMLDLQREQDRKQLKLLTDRWLGAGLDPRTRDVHVTDAGLRLLRRLVQGQEARSALDLAKVLEENLDRTPNLRERLAILSYKASQRELARELLLARSTSLRQVARDRQTSGSLQRAPAQVDASLPPAARKNGDPGEVEPLTPSELRVLQEIRRSPR